MAKKKKGTDLAVSNAPAEQKDKGDAAPKAETQSAITTGTDPGLVDQGATVPAGHAAHEQPDGIAPPEEPEPSPELSDEEKRGIAEQKIEDKLTVKERLGRVEAALGAGVGVNVRNYTDRNILLEREAIIAEATQKAAEIVRDAIIEAAEPLSDQERIDRIEAAMKSGTPLGNLL